MPIERINVPLVLSYDTRGVLSFAESNTNGKDQRRVNCIYEITRGAAGAEPTASLSRRPGVTDVGNTYGAATQVQYLVGSDPASAWNAYTPWIAVKDGTANKVVNASTATTVLTDTDYSPRFLSTIRMGGTQYALLQLQNKADPVAASNGQKVYYSSAIGTWTQISAATFTALNVRGQMIELDGWVFVANGEDDGIYNQTTQNDLTSTWVDKITISSTFDEIQGLAALRRRILAFGRETVECFEIPSPGNATGSVLNRIANTTDRVGLGDVAGPASLDGKTHYYTVVNDMLFYLGRFGNVSADHSLIVYDGNRHFKVSKEYEDKMMSTTTVYSVTRMSFHGKVGVAIQLTAPSATTQHWLVYFPDLNEFFQFTSTVFSPVNNGYHYAGATNPQKLYYFASSNNWQDAGSNFTMTVQFKIPAKDAEFKEGFIAGLVGDTMSSSENIAISFSVDDGTTWSTARNIDMSKAHKFVRKVPLHRELMVRLTHTGANETRLRRFYMDVAG